MNIRAKLSIFVAIMGLLILTVLPSQVFAQVTLPVYFEAETQIHQALAQKGYQSSYVYASSSQLVMRVNIPEINSDLPLQMLNIAAEGYKFFDKTSNIIVQIYFEEQPIFQMTAATVDVGAYLYKSISIEEIFDRLEIVDLRSPEELLRQDIVGIGVYVHDVRINTNKAQVVLKYFGDYGEEMLQEYITMAFLAVQNAPWVKTVEFVFSYQGGTGLARLSSSTNDILRLFEGNMNEERFIKKIKTHIQVIKPLTGWRRSIAVAIQKVRNIAYGDLIVLGMIGTILLVIIVHMFKFIRLFTRKKVLKPNKIS